MRKPALFICKFDSDLLRGNRKADQRLCFLYIESTIPLRSKPDMSSLYCSYTIAVEPSLCLIWLETP